MTNEMWNDFYKIVFQREKNNKTERIYVTYRDCKV